MTFGIYRVKTLIIPCSLKPEGQTTKEEGTQPALLTLEDHLFLINSLRVNGG